MKILLSLSREGSREDFQRCFFGQEVELRGGYLPPVTEQGDALILGGGGDVAPLPGEEQGLFRKVDELRDQRETALFQRFLEEGKPILGICRGHQLMARLLGGALIAQLPTAKQHQQEKDCFHWVQIEKDSFLFALYGQGGRVNSNHHQGVRVPGVGMRCIARSPDGLCEGTEHSFLPLRSVQWHPERMEDGTRFFGDFVSWVKKLRTKKA